MQKGVVNRDTKVILIIFLFFHQFKESLQVSIKMHTDSIIKPVCFYLYIQLKIKYLYMLITLALKTKAKNELVQNTETNNSVMIM